MERFVLSVCATSLAAHLYRNIQLIHMNQIQTGIRVGDQSETLGF